MLSTFLYIVAAIIAGIYFISKRKFNYWKKQNVPYTEPTPIFGNYADFILQRKHLSYVLEEHSKKFSNEPYFGAFFGTEPTLVVKDPDLLKLIMTKDFYYFYGREASNHVDREEFTQNLFNNCGDQWRVIRQNLTPVFTSAKMKNMFYLIANCSNEYERFLDEEIKASNVIEARTHMARFTMACIVSCAFGVDSATMEEKHEENPFTKVGNAFFTSSRVQAAKFTFKALWPAIFYSLGFKVASEDANQFFRKFILEVFEARKYKPTPRNDFVDFILNFKTKSHIVGDSITNLKTRSDKKVELPVTDNLLLSQCEVFFLAGFETTATTTSYTLYNLAKHPEAQKKVQEEIDAYLQKYDNKLTYDIVNELTYTYACVEETLRLFPPVATITREVMEDYTLPSGVFLEKGVRIHIPVYHMHRDPKFFPDPEVYRPERFLGEERQNIVPYSYMPFGEGSRLCIGMRFAKMQLLAGLVTFLKKCNVHLKDPSSSMVFEPQPFIPAPKEGLNLRVTVREGWESRLFNKD